MFQNETCFPLLDKYQDNYATSQLDKTPSKLLDNETTIRQLDNHKIFR